MVLIKEKSLLIPTYYLCQTERIIYSVRDLKVYGLLQAVIRYFFQFHINREDDYLIFYNVFLNFFYSVFGIFIVC